MDLDHVFTVLLAGGKGQRLDVLTRERAKPAVPFGGAYRIIDFTLSNCVNSGLRKVLVPVQYRSRSLNEHIRFGWSQFFSPSRGEFVETAPPQQVLGEQWYLGTADAVRQNLFVIRERKPEAVLILSGDHIYKMNYRAILKAHEKKGADVTVSAVAVPRKEASSFGVLCVDKEGRIERFQEKPDDPEPLPNASQTCLASMGVYVFRFETLERLLEEDAADPGSCHDFGKNILPMLPGRCGVYAYRFVDMNKKAKPYWRDVGTVDAYYEANMDLVNVDPQLNLYDESWPVYRRATLAPPPKFVFEELGPGGRCGMALNSLVAPGSIVSGGRVFRSIVSPHVRVHSYSLVEDSILFSGVDVGRHAKIRRAIIDKDVSIPEGMEIGYDLERDRKRFTVSEGGVVVISKRAVVEPDRAPSPSPSPSPEPSPLISTPA
ncbi:MAG: glucose-1-phosphate adenylyltransferase [Elusimicrobiota bacterium]